MLDNSEVLAKSMNAIVSIIDSDDSGTITEQEFIKSAKVSRGHFVPWRRFPSLRRPAGLLATVH